MAVQALPEPERDDVREKLLLNAPRASGGHNALRRQILGDLPRPWSARVRRAFTAAMRQSLQRTISSDVPDHELPNVVWRSYVEETTAHIRRRLRVARAFLERA